MEGRHLCLMSMHSSSMRTNCPLTYLCSSTDVHVHFRCGCRGDNAAVPSGVLSAPAHRSSEEHLLEQLQQLKQEAKKAKDTCADLSKQVNSAHRWKEVKSNGFFILFLFVVNIIILQSLR